MEEVEEKGFKALVEEREKHVKILIDIAAWVDISFKVLFYKNLVFYDLYMPFS
jgi:hypothetical protein